jgi:hypothetical protein
LAAVILINPGGVIPTKAVIKPKNKETIKFIGKIRGSKKQNYSLILNRIYVIALLISKYCFS